MKHERILVAEDDARWSSELTRQTSVELIVVETLSKAMAMLDGRRRWTGAIFDRYLIGGNPSFSDRLANDAGFILAVAFLQKFPDRRVCVCTGDPDMMAVPAAFIPLVSSDNCTYLYKGRAQAAARALRFVIEGKRTKFTVDNLLDHLVLQPNMFGLGLNLRTIISSIIDGCRSRSSKKR